MARNNARVTIQRGQYGIPPYILRSARRVDFLRKIRDTMWCVNMNKPPPNTINKKGRANFPDGKILKFRIIDEIKHQQSSYKDKYFYLQKIIFENGVAEYRFCYYIIGKKPAMKGKWVYGQFAPFIPKVDLEEIIKKAVKRNFLKL